MKPAVVVVFALSLIIGSHAFAQIPSEQHSAGSSVSAGSYSPVHEYDPKRDAAKDIKAAVAEAARTHRRVLVEIGGRWCIWCTYMDKFFAENVSLRTYRDENYVMVKVNFSPENKNEKVISQYGSVPGYPHIFVLENDGRLLHSQNSSALEEGRGYSAQAMAKFLDKWRPKP